MSAQVKKAPNKEKKVLYDRIFILLIGVIKLKKENVKDPTINADEMGIRLSFNKFI